MEQILLNKYKSKNSKNITNNINLDFENDYKNLPYNNINKLVDAYDVFIDECQNSNKYKLICTIKPICTNVLFNAITEISKYETDGSITRLTNEPISSNLLQNVINKSGVTRELAIRNTEYSNNTGFQYFCGMDIFNNHILRSKTFKCVNLIYSINNVIPQSARTVYNTIEDYMRLDDGKVVRSNVPFNILKEIDTHLYTREDINSFNSSFINGISEDNGWVGFINKTRIETKKNNKVNKVINSKNNNEFIDFCPSRNLFDFIPQYNEALNRYESNWDVILTYPFSSTTNELISFMCDNKEKTGIRVYDANIISNGGKKLLEITTVSNHNLLKNNSFILYFKDEITQQYNRINKDIKVYNVGDINGKSISNKFIIDVSPLLEYGIVDENYDLTNSNMFIRKLYSGCECDYYYRLLKTMPNLKNSKEIPTTYEILEDLINTDSDKYEIELNSLGFSKTIFGDNIAQGIVMDDIVIAYNDGDIKIMDNLGRPISELFVTIIKKNIGSEYWYNTSANTIPISASNEIEISHIFGIVTDGLDFDYEIQNKSGFSETHNVKFLTNVDEKYIKNNINKTSPFNSGITSNDEYFYCDLIEFNNLTHLETTLNNINYRFNTAQRETTNSLYQKARIDNIIIDDFEVSGLTSGFTVQTTYIGDSGSPINIQPEGYYYKPHYNFKIKNTSSTVNQDYKPLILIDDIYTLNSGETWVVKTKTAHGLKKGVLIDISHMNKSKTNELNSEKISVKDIISPIRFEIESQIIYDVASISVDDAISDILIRGGNDNIPDWATKLSDGSGRYFWRNLTIPNDNKIIGGLELPFTNGSFYVNKQINFFLKRQDPYGKYLSYQNDLIVIAGREVDYSKDEAYEEMEETIC